MTRVCIYDRENDKRLLGSLPTGFLPPRRNGDHTAMVGVAVVGEGPMADIKTIRFQVKCRIRDDWSAEAYLTTDAYLEDLMALPEFNLPRETSYLADRRRADARYSA
jgi:hypothetical protein